MSVNGIIVSPESFGTAEQLTRAADLRAPRSGVRCFLELCSLLEAIVLYEEVHTYVIGEMSKLRSFPLCYQLIKHGILKELPSMTHTGGDVGKKLEIVGALAEKLFLEDERSDKYSPIYGSGLLNDIELESLTADTGLAFKPLALRDMVKPVSSGTIRAHGELKQLYDSLTMKLKDKTQLRFDRGYPYRIFIPPVAAIVLEQARDIEHIPDAVLEVREKFSKTREKFNQLESVFSDDNYSLADVIEAERELKSLSQVLLADDEHLEGARVAFLRDFGTFLIKSLLKMGIDFESLYRLLSSDVAEWVDRKYKRRGALLLLDVSKKYKSIKRYGSLIERVFGFTLDEHDLRVIRHYEVLHKMNLGLDVEQFSKGVRILNYDS